MSDTAFLKITTAIVQKLGAASDIDALIYQARDRQVPEQAKSAINVQFESGLPSRGVIRGAPVDWDSRFVIEVYARTTAQTPDAAVDPLLSAVYREIASDPTLGGLTDDIGEPVIEAEYSSEGKKTGWVRMTYPVQHRTANMTLE
jgi:hypothetical protein